MLKKIPHTYTIIFSIILLCAVLSWIIPAGEYSRHTVEVNGTTRSVIVDNSYHAVESVPQTWQVFSALLQGFEKQAGIIAFLLIIGGGFQIMNNSRAIDVGIFSFLRFTQGLERHRFMKRIGVNNLVIAMIIFLFSMFGQGWRLYKTGYDYGPGDNDPRMYTFIPLIGDYSATKKAGWRIWNQSREANMRTNGGFDFGNGSGGAVRCVKNYK